MSEGPTVACRNITCDKQVANERASVWKHFESANKQMSKNNRITSHFCHWPINFTPSRSLVTWLRPNLYFFTQRFQQASLVKFLTKSVAQYSQCRALLFCYFRGNTARGNVIIWCHWFMWGFFFFTSLFWFWMVFINMEMIEEKLSEVINYHLHNSSDRPLSRRL